jgi:hypothetical protein
MRLTLKDDLPFISINLSFAGQTTEIEDILVDTVSASTILAADAVSVIKLTPQPTDELRIIRGVGGTEIVFSRVVDYVAVGERSVSSFEIEVGGMDYGFPVNGILGMDFLNRTGAIINLKDLQIEFEGEP